MAELDPHIHFSPMKSLEGVGPEGVQEHPPATDVAARALSVALRILDHLGFPVAIP